LFEIGKQRLGFGIYGIVGGVKEDTGRTGRLKIVKFPVTYIALFMLAD